LCPGSNIKTNTSSLHAISYVFVAQVSREAAPNTWHSNSKTSVANCVVCARKSARSDVTMDTRN